MWERQANDQQPLKPGLAMGLSTLSVAAVPGCGQFITAAAWPDDTHSTRRGSFRWGRQQTYSYQMGVEMDSLHRLACKMQEGRKKEAGAGPARCDFLDNPFLPSVS